MSSAILINMLAFTDSRHYYEFQTFFYGGANFINSLLTLVLCFIMVAFIIYSYYRIHTLSKSITKKHVQQKLENLIDNCN